MIILDGSGEALTGVMGAAVDTTAPKFSCTYADVSSGDLDGITDVSSQSGSFNGTTDVDLVSAPSGSNERDIKYIHIHNEDAVEQTFVISHAGNAIFQCVLVAGGSATYSSERGWQIYDDEGVAQFVGATGPQGATGAQGPQGPQGADGQADICGADTDTSIDAAADYVLVDNCGTDGQRKVLWENTPTNAHAASHQNGGSDEINVAGLSGELADPQPPKTHASDHERAGSDEIDGDHLDIDFTPSNYTPSTSPAEAANVDDLAAHLAGIDDEIGTNATNLSDHEADTANPHGTDIENLGSGTLAELNDAITDATLDDASDPRDPNAHAASHQNGGSDEINVAGLSGELADPQPPKTHASTHITGGSDEIDGDKLDIDWNPTNYTPTTSPTEADSVDNLTAHLAGIDTALASAGGTFDLCDEDEETGNTDNSIEHMLVDDCASGGPRKVLIEQVTPPIHNICDFRLTGTTGTPVTISDVSNISTLYLSPYKGNKITLYDGTNYKVMSSSEVSLALSGLTSGKPYDVWAYDNAGTLTLEFLVWTNDTTRATALAFDNIIGYYKSGDLTRKYVGTFYTTSATQTQDTAYQRLLWNNYNRVIKKLKKQDTNDSSWSVSGHSSTDNTSWAYANGDATNRVEVMTGLGEDVVQVLVGATHDHSGTSVANSAVGIGRGNTTDIADYGTSFRQNGDGAADRSTGALVACLNEAMLGFRDYRWLEKCWSSSVTSNNTNVTFGATGSRGITGFVRG